MVAWQSQVWHTLCSSLRKPIYFFYVHLQLTVPSPYITDGFKSDAYRKQYVSLKAMMDPGPTRDLCFQEGLITVEQKQDLATRRNFSNSDHNEQLLIFLESGSDKAFKTFCEKVLAKEPNDKFRAVLESFCTA